MGYLTFVFWFFVIGAAIVALLYAIAGVAFVVEKVRNPGTRWSAAPHPVAVRLRQADAHGPINPAMVCLHCQTSGQVHTRPVTEKKGISGGKTTAALLTGGVSMMATGLSRKERLTRAKCGHCQSTWTF